MSYDVLDSWAGLFDRLAQALGGVPGRVDGEAYEEAELWFRQAVSAHFGVDSLRDLDRAGRQRAFQRAAATIMVVGELGELAFRFGIRDELRGAFARTWDGVELEGPPWRLDPSESDRPSFRAHFAEDDFGAPPSAAADPVA